MLRALPFLPRGPARGAQFHPPLRSSNRPVGRSVGDHFAGQRGERGRSGQIRLACSASPGTPPAPTLGRPRKAKEAKAEAICLFGTARSPCRPRCEATESARSERARGAPGFTSPSLTRTTTSKETRAQQSRAKKVRGVCAEEKVNLRSIWRFESSCSCAEEARISLSGIRSANCRSKHQHRYRQKGSPRCDNCKKL